MLALSGLVDLVGSCLSLIITIACRTMHNIDKDFQCSNDSGVEAV